MSCPRGCCSTYREHLDGVRLGVTSQRMQEDRRGEQDMHAYARLVRSGVQPKGIDGAATLEREASTAFEVENGKILTDSRERRKLLAALQAAPPPSTTPLDAA